MGAEWVGKTGRVRLEEWRLGTLWRVSLLVKRRWGAWWWWGDLRTVTSSCVHLVVSTWRMK